MIKEKNLRVFCASVLAAFALSACGSIPATEDGVTGREAQSLEYETVAEVPEYDGEPYVEINENQPEFSEEEITAVSFEAYSELDELGRCGAAEACIGEDLMPTEDRESISSVIPTGWENNRYENVDGEYLYNRCHLIGYQLSGENANKENLITGTRYMNTEGMLPFEDMVAEYIHETDNHVMYRVTPVFEEDNLVASGVQMEAESVEDDGEGVCFNVYVYNVQPDITIDYATGANWLTEDGGAAEQAETSNEKVAREQAYIINVNSRKFHKADCSGAEDIKEENKREYIGNRKELVKEGYEPCGRCNP